MVHLIVLAGFPCPADSAIGSIEQIADFVRALSSSGNATCAAETVFVTVGAPAPSIGFGTTVMSMVSTETVAVSTVTVYPESVSTGFSATAYPTFTETSSGAGPASGESS